MKLQNENNEVNNAATDGYSYNVSYESDTPLSIDHQTAITGTQQQIKLLAASNACLRRNLVRFSRGLKQVSQYAYYDALTGLPNRTLLMDRLHQAMLQAVRQRKHVLLLSVDLDHFKWVSTQLGVAKGDTLLQQVALRLTTSIRGADTVCRYGGNTFVLMLPEIDSKQSAAAAVLKIRAQLAEHYVIEDQMIALSASIGVILYRGGEQSGEDLIQQAESNMQRNKVQSDPPTLFVVAET